MTGCTLAMALLALCPFSLANEPESPYARGRNSNPVMELIDLRAQGREPTHARIMTEPVRRRGTIHVRTRG
jgi:hypothetical protein